MSERITRNFCRNVYLLNAKIDHLMTFETDEGPMTREQFYIVEFVKDFPDITQKEIIQMMKKEQTAISRSINKLMDEGYITKTRSDEDMRASYLNITDKGNALIDEFDDEICQVTDDLLDKLSDKEVAKLLQLVEKIYQ